MFCIHTGQISTGKNTQPNIKYNLFIKSLINELSSNTNASNAIIKLTNDSIQIHIVIVTKNSAKFPIPNRGNLPKTKKIIIHDPIHTAKIFNIFLKNHCEKQYQTNEIGLFKYVTIDHHLISSIMSLSLRFVIINSAMKIYQAYIHISIHEIVSIPFAFAPKATSIGMINTKISRCILLISSMYMQ